MSLRIQRLVLDGTDDLRTASAILEGARPGALLALQTPIIVALHRQIADLAIKARLPTMYIAARITLTKSCVAAGRAICP